MKCFNTEGLCNPDMHYMVDIQERIIQIKKLIDDKKYFTIHRARQYGKTTTITALRKAIAQEYVVVSLDFQGIGQAGFSTEEKFVQEFSQLIIKRRRTISYIPEEIENKLNTYVRQKKAEVRLGELFITLNEWCELSEKGIVLMIDEVDSATNNQVFLDFLSQLREGYNVRLSDGIPTFQSVILVGVTDVKHLKSKIRDEDQSKVNSPWNIAVDFDMDMSLSETGIKGMLDEYEADHNTGMDTGNIAEQIHAYTSGYPYLVSKICQILDQGLVPEKFENLSGAWTGYGIDEAVKMILSDGNIALFDSLIGKLTNYPELRDKLRGLLLLGDVMEYLPDDEPQKQLKMYGFVKVVNNKVAISNRIFEMRLYKQFIGESKYDDLRQLAASEKNIFIEDGVLDVPKIMQHFIDSQKIIHEEYEQKFAEEEGRERFLTYLSPIINGTGTYSIEEQTRTHRRMDVVVHYLGKRYVIELKIWRGERYNADGEKQLKDYLDYFGLDTGYLLSFNFNKKKEREVKRLTIDGKVLYEGMV